jgi:hypothetical protein
MDEDHMRSGGIQKILSISLFRSDPEKLSNKFIGKKKILKISNA